MFTNTSRVLMNFSFVPINTALMSVSTRPVLISKG